MSVPTQPTLNSIVSEGLKRGGFPSGGNAAQITQAEGWVEESKTDLWNECRLRGITIEGLLITSHGILTEGISAYALPNDCDEVLSITLLDSDYTGICQAVAAGQVTLATAEDISEDEAVGRYLLLTSGTGGGNCSQISAYNTTTKVAILTPNFTGSVFDGNENYMIVMDEKELDLHHIKAKDAIKNSTNKDQPTDAYLKGQANADTDETGEFEVVPCPDDLYGVRLRYYLNICLIDLATQSATMGLLYRKLRNYLVQGVIWRCQQQDRNTEYKDSKIIYDQMLLKLVKAEDDNDGGFMSDGAY